MLLWDLASIRPMPSPLHHPSSAPSAPRASGRQPGLPGHSPDQPPSSESRPAQASSPVKTPPVPPPYLHDVHAAPAAAASVCLKSSACSFAVRQTAVSADARTVLAVTEDGSLWRWDRC